jgi:uncharacterized protein (TIRG00374 family)
MDIFAYSQIGFLANNLLPLRAGELLRAVLLGQRHAISKSAVLATIAVERVLDVLCLLLFASVLAPVMEMPQMVKQSILFIAGVGISAVAALWVLSSREALIERLMRRVLIVVPSPLRERVADFVTAFTQGLQALQSGGRLLLLLALSLLAWLFVLFEFLFMFICFDVTLPWYAGVFVLVVLNVGIAIPSSPGFIGVYHFLVVTALSVFGVSKAEALSIALVTHGLCFIINNLLGFAFLWRENVAFGQLRRGKDISGVDGTADEG